MSVIAPRKRPVVEEPSGEDSLAVRIRFLKRRHTQRITYRGLVAAWITVGAVVCWLFVAGFAGLGH